MRTQPTDQEILTGIKQGWGILKIKAEIGGGQARIQKLRDEYRCQTTPNSSNTIPCSTSAHQPSTMSPTTLTKSQVEYEDTPSEDSTQVLSPTTQTNMIGTPIHENERVLPSTNAFVPNPDSIRAAWYLLTGTTSRTSTGETLKQIARAALYLTQDYM